MKKIQFYENKNVIHKQLKILRIGQGFTQGELAAKMQIMNVNIDQQMISRIEHNDRIVTDYELACFSAVLHVPIEQLLGDFIKSEEGD